MSLPPDLRPSLAARLMHAPAALLLAVGALLGLNFPLGKLAGAAGVPLVRSTHHASECGVVRRGAGSD